MAGRAETPVHYSVPQWIDENEKYFLPPVCNKMMHNTQLKVFYVGGPNQRKDYHLEEGEELFYMRKGDMCLKILEGEHFRDVHIREGQLFLLPSRIPHSPQRQASTVGLVIERERLLGRETDGLRYYVEDGSTDSLFERWFYCDDLGSQLGPVIKEYFASEQHRTGKPIAEDLPARPPWMPDSRRRVEQPFDLNEWLDANMDSIRSQGQVRMFDTSYQTDVLVLGQGDPGKGARNLKSVGGETFLWQVRGHSRVQVDGQVFRLQQDHTLLVPDGKEYKFDTDDEDAAVLAVKMDPENKKRIPEQP